MSEDVNKGDDLPDRLVQPAKHAVPGADTRAAWLRDVERGFVNPSKANKGHYMAILECLWPSGHGIPGPHKSEQEVRQAIDDRRQAASRGKHVGPYQDPFRRVRELQGEEGVFGLIHQGRKLQLAHTTVGAKRVPRTGLSDPDWERVLKRDGHACTVCSRQEGDVDLQQDHRVPRLRGGGDELANWQPLCTECNNFKSTMCRACMEDCQKCSWAYPEKYGLLRISGDNIVAARSLARKLDENVHDLVNGLLEESLRSLRRSRPSDR